MASNLKMTLAQARRLWQLDGQGCEAVLHQLHEQWLIAKDSRGFRWPKPSRCREQSSDKSAERFLQLIKNGGWRSAVGSPSPNKSVGKWLNAAYRFPAGTVLFGSFNHFFVPPPVENVLVGSAGLTR